MTATDVAVKLKLADIGDKSKVEQLDYETARKAMEQSVPWSRTASTP